MLAQQHGVWHSPTHETAARSRELTLCETSAFVAKHSVLWRFDVACLPACSSCATRVAKSCYSRDPSHLEVNQSCLMAGQRLRQMNERSRTKAGFFPGRAGAPRASAQSHRTCFGYLSPVLHSATGRILSLSTNSSAQNSRGSILFDATWTLR